MAMLAPRTRPSPPPQLGAWTYERYCAIPDDGNRYEVIWGELYVAPAPNVRHQHIVMRLGRFLDRKRSQGLCVEGEEEQRNRVAVLGGSSSSGEVAEEGAALLLAGGGGRPDALHAAVAAVALGAAAALAPQHGRAAAAGLSVPSPGYHVAAALSR